jgi:glycerol-3-phosphate O-acyltransferase / dihydroxyacetone phosphate acyltransferase
MTDKVNLGYFSVRAFGKFWINRFFRKIQVLGTENVIPGPVIFAINHPNNLVDSLVVAYAIERKIHYLATAQLFSNKLMSLFLHNMGVIPVYRKQDDSSHGQKNVSMFQACYEILKDGGAIGIYPEGTTHAEPRIRKIKTGAARIALEAENLYHPGLKLVPVGLNFSVRKSFRSEVIVSIGPPISASTYLEKYQSAPAETVEQLTDDLQKAIEAQVIVIDEPELDLLVKQIEEIYKGELIRDLIEIRGLKKEEIDRFQLSKRLIAGIHYFNEKNPDLIRRIQEEIEAYTGRLKKIRVHDSLIEALVNNPTSYKRFLLRIVLMLICLPPALWGAANHFFPYQISRIISRKIAKKETDYATVRILSGIVLYTLFYAAQIYAVLRWFGLFPAIFYGITLPIAGAFAYYYKEKFRKMREDFKLLSIMITRKQLLQKLVEQRERLIALMDEAKEEYLRATAQA